MGAPMAGCESYTLEDWAGWEGRWELIRGVAYNMTPAPSTSHQALAMSLGSTIFQALKEATRKPGQGGLGPEHCLIGWTYFNTPI